MKIDDFGTAYRLAEAPDLFTADVAIVCKEDTRNVHGRWALASGLVIGSDYGSLLGGRRTGTLDRG